MKKTALMLLLAAISSIAYSQTPATQAVDAPKPAATAPAANLPAAIPVVTSPIETLFTIPLRYQEITVGTGAPAEPGKVYKVHYTGWRAADGVKFDSSYDHLGVPPQDKDGKPVLGDDGKPKLGDPQPMTFPQGLGRVPTGFDQGLAGMKVGGKRRIFIPWQLAYGVRGMPAHGPEHPGIPAKSDLIYDVELLDVTDMSVPATPSAPPTQPVQPAH
jgi:peptidylprolyl isomerase